MNDAIILSPQKESYVQYRHTRSATNVQNSFCNTTDGHLKYKNGHR